MKQRGGNNCDFCFPFCVKKICIKIKFYDKKFVSKNFVYKMQLYQTPTWPCETLSKKGFCIFIYFNKLQHVTLSFEYSEGSVDGSEGSECRQEGSEG